MNIKSIEYQELKRFEDTIKGNVKVGGYEMDKVCPIPEGECYKIQLQEKDISRLYLLHEPTFTDLTFKRNYLLSGLNSEEAIKLDRVIYWLDRSLDLRLSPEWSPVFVSSDTENSPIITIDGNHRLMTHFHLHQKIEGLNGYLFVHPKIKVWHPVSSPL